MIETTNRPGRLRGTALWVAIVCAGVLLGAAWWAGQVDLNSEPDRNTGPLDVLSTLYKVLIFVGLWVVARRMHSASVRMLALLVLALTVGGIALDIGSVSSVIDSVATRLADVVPVSVGRAGTLLVFGALALVAVGLVVAAYRATEDSDRSLVVNLIGLLFLVGIYVGPVNAISSFGINREWLFAEDFGQVVMLAILGSYVAGLVVSTRAGSE